MQGTELVLTATLCFVEKTFYILFDIPYWVYKGGLLCAENCVIWFLMFWR